MGLREPLSHSEIRVLRYLPTKLSGPEIADQLYLSVNTVKTHMRHVYDKLGAHRRHEAAALRATARAARTGPLHAGDDRTAMPKRQSHPPRERVIGANHPAV